MKRLLLIYVLFFLGHALSAQSKKGDFKFVSKSDIVVDGQLEEWGNLHALGEDSTWLFSAAKDKEHIYVVVEITDPILQVEAARNGILVNINVNAKKRDGIQLLFPVPDNETIRAMLNDEDLKPENVKQQLIERSRGYRVKGFPSIVDGLLSFENTYGIKAVAQVNEKGKLIYEAVIPINQIRLKDTHQVVALQILVNNRWTAMQKMRANQSNRYQGMYGGRMMPSGPQLKAPFKGKTDVWFVDSL